MDPAKAEAFRRIRAESGIRPLVVHLPYLPNFGSTKPDLRGKSLLVLKEEMERSRLLGAEYVVIHPGHTAKGQDRGESLDLVARAMAESLPDGPEPPRLLVETMAGQRGEIGASFEELDRIVHTAESIRPDIDLGVCLDTAHVWGAGYDVAGNLDGVLEDFDRIIGLERLAVIHLNDSRNELGSGVDRHAPPGKGRIGSKAMARIVRHPAFKNMAGIMESPRQTIQDDLDNMARVKRWRRYRTAGVNGNR